MPTPISTLPSATALVGNELIPIVQSGTTKQMTPTSLGTYTAVRVPRHRGLQVLGIGDSLWQGSSNRKGATSGHVDLAFQLMLASAGLATCVPNGGIGGQTAPMIASRIQRDIIRFEPDVVVVTLGTNDAVAGQGATYIARSLDAINAALLAAGIPWVLTNIPPSTTYNTGVQAVNAAIATWAAANGKSVADINTPLANGTAYKTNYSADDRHWIAPVGQIVAGVIWSAIMALVDTHWTTAAPYSIDVGNLFYKPTDLTGTPTTNGDPLCLTWRSFTQNGFTVNLPYFFGTQFGSGVAPTVVGTVGALAGVVGNAFTITATPNGVGSYTARSNALDVSNRQGRRLRFRCIFGCSGLSTDNTNAYLAANSNTPVSGVGISLSCNDAAGSTISNVALIDPTDTAGNASGGTGAPIAAAIPNQTQILIGYNGATANSWCVDQTPVPITAEINIPAGATTLAVTVGLSLRTGAVSPISLILAQFELVDIGPAVMRELPTALPVQGKKKVTAAYTITSADSLTIPVWHCDATTASFALTLPDVVVAAGRTLVFVKTDSGVNTITVTQAGSATINGATTRVLALQYDTFRLYSDGSNWFVQ